MKYFYLLSLLILFCGLSVVAQKTGKSSFHINEEGQVIETTDPIFKFNQETHDFGEIPEDGSVTYEFSFTNVGVTPLIIEGAKASCGCTTPEWPQTPIEPNAEGKIKVSYNTKGRPGNFNKAITITSNAVTPTKRIFIKGNVIPTPAPVTVPTEVPTIIENH